MLIAKIGNRVETVTAPWLAAAEPREREPAASPRAVRLHGLPRIVGACRQMPAICPDERRQHHAIERDRREERRFCDRAKRAHGYGSPFLRLNTQRPPSLRATMSMSLYSATSFAARVPT